MQEYGYSAADIDNIISRGNFTTPYSLQDQQDAFHVIGIDAIISLVRNLQVYAHVGSFLDDEDSQLTEGYGLGLGLISSLANIFKFQFEYRLKEKDFKFSWFDKNYESIRGRVINSNVVTADNTIVAVTNDKISHGAYGKLSINAFNILNFVAGYEIFLLENGEEQRLFMNMGLNPQLTKKLPVLDSIDFFYENNKITKSEDFTENNPHLFYGYTIGFDLGGAVITYLQRFGFVYDKDGKLVQDRKMLISMGTAF